MFNFAVSGVDKVLDVELHGNVNLPDFELSESDIDFGDVSLGFSSKKSISIVNNSPIDVEFILSIKSDGSFLRKEFDIEPSLIRLKPHHSDTFTVTFLPISAGHRHNELLIGITDLSNQIMHLPISAQVIVPELTVEKQFFNFDELFIKHPFKFSFQIHNPTSLYSRFSIQHPPVGLTSIVKVETFPSAGVVGGNQSIQIDVVLTPFQIGPCKTSIRVDSVGSLCENDDSSRHSQQIEFSFSGRGPLLSVSPSEIDFQSIRLLKEEAEQLTIRNDGLIPAVISCYIPDKSCKILKKKHSRLPKNFIIPPPFSLSQSEFTIPPGSDFSIDVVAVLADAMGFTDSAVIVVDSADDIIVPIKARGVGVPLYFCDMELDSNNQAVIDFDHVITHSKSQQMIRVENRGFSSQSLSWSFDADDSAFVVKPLRATLEPLHFQIFSISALSETEVNQERVLSCLCSTPSAPSGKAADFILKANFQRPLLEVSAESINFDYVWTRDDCNPQPQFVSFNLTNSSKIPLSCSLYLPIVSGLTFDDGSRDLTHIELIPDESYDVTVYTFFSESIIIDYCNHPKKDKIPLQISVSYPGLSFPTTSVNFGGTLANIKKMIMNTVTNTTQCHVSAVFSLIGDDDGTIRPKTPGNLTVNPADIFFCSPVSFELEPNQSKEVVFEFMPSALGQYDCGMICDIEGTNYVELTLTGFAGALDYKIDDVIDFDCLLIGDVASKEVLITNTGSLALDFKIQNSSSKYFNISPTKGSVKPRQTKRLSVKFTPFNHVSVFKHEFIVSFNDVLSHAVNVSGSACFSRLFTSLPLVMDNLNISAVVDSLTSLQNEFGPEVFKTSIFSIFSSLFNDQKVFESYTNNLFSDSQVLSGTERLLFLDGQSKRSLGGPPLYTFNLEFGFLPPNSVKEIEYIFYNTGIAPVSANFSPKALKSLTRHGITLYPEKISKLPPGEQVQCKAVFNYDDFLKNIKSSQLNFPFSFSDSFTVALNNGGSYEFKTSYSVDYPKIEILTNDVDFDILSLGEAKEIQGVCLRNTSAVPADVTMKILKFVESNISSAPFSVCPDKYSPFRIGSPSNTVNVPPFTTVMVPIQFCPLKSSDCSARMSLSLMGKTIGSVNLTGKVIGVDIDFDPSSVDFGVIEEDELSETLQGSFTVKNPSDNDLELFCPQSIDDYHQFVNNFMSNAIEPEFSLLFCPNDEEFDLPEPRLFSSTLRQLIFLEFQNRFELSQKNPDYTPVPKKSKRSKSTEPTSVAPEYIPVSTVNLISEGTEEFFFSVESNLTQNFKIPFFLSRFPFVPLDFIVKYSLPEPEPEVEPVVVEPVPEVKRTETKEEIPEISELFNIDVGNVNFGRVLSRTQNFQKVLISNLAPKPIQLSINIPEDLQEVLSVMEGDTIPIKSKGSKIVQFCFSSRDSFDLLADVMISASFLKEQSDLIDEKSVSVEGESYVINVDVNVPVQSKDQVDVIDFGDVRVGEKHTVPIKITNKGKYPVDGEFSFKKAFKSFSLLPKSFTLAPAESIISYCVFSAQKSGSLKSDLMALYLCDSELKVMTSPIGFKVRLNAEDPKYYSNVPNSLNFGIVEPNTASEREISFENRGKKAFLVQFSNIRDFSEDWSIEPDIPAEIEKPVEKGKSKANVPTTKPQIDRPNMISQCGSFDLPNFVKQFSNSLSFDGFSLTSSCVLVNPGEEINVSISFKASSPVDQTVPMYFKISGISSVFSTDLSVTVDLPKISNNPLDFANHLTIFHTLPSSILHPSLFCTEDNSIYFKPILFLPSLSENSENIELLNEFPMSVNTSDTIVKLFNNSSVDCAVKVALSSQKAEKSKGKQDKSVFSTTISDINISANSSVEVPITCDLTAPGEFSGQLTASIVNPDGKYNDCLDLIDDFVVSFRAVGVSPKLEIFHNDELLEFSGKKTPELKFSKLFLGRSQTRVYSLKNPTDLPFIVNCSIKDSSSLPFSIDGDCVEIVLLPQSEKAVPLVFRPSTVGVFNSEVTFSVFGTNFKNSMKISGESIDADIEFVGSNEENLIDLGESILGSTLSKQFKILNKSSNMVRYQFDLASLDSSVKITPSSGHILPGNSFKEVRIDVNPSDADVVLNPLPLQYQSIELTDQSLNLSSPFGSGWDNSITEPKVMTSAEFKDLTEKKVEKVSKKKESKPKAKSNAQNISKLLNIEQPEGDPDEVQCFDVPVAEPEFTDLKNNGQLPLSLSFSTDKRIYECEISGSIKFRQTLLFQSRVFSFEVSNPSKITLPMTWKFYNDNDLEDPQYYSISPSSTVIKPGKSEQFVLKFHPTAPELNFSRTLHADIPSLSPNCHPLSFAVDAAISRPICYFDMGSLDQSSDSFKKLLEGNQGAHGIVIKAIKVGVAKEVSFYVLNPTDRDYDFVWQSEDNPGPIKCITRQGMIAKGKKFKMIFAFKPENLISVSERVFKFVIPSRGIDEPFLVRGEIAPN
ncbi:hypothetical protein GEMRC1_004022 [Eukaryota sp. GEM-RC1]